MAVVVSMLRGINLGAHKRVKMDDLRGLYESLGYTDVRTHIQSGNVIFSSKDRNMVTLARRIGKGIEDTFGFQSEVVVRSIAELKDVVARNPFAGRKDMDPSRFLVNFLVTDPGDEARAAVLKIKTEPEELRIIGREAYIYFPNGMARPKMSWPAIERTLKTSGTGRNWNTVMKLIEIAEALEASR